METLVLDGKEYVKASKAAAHAGYTTDYVGQLCRSGKVDAKLIGRSWYVNLDQLGSHRTESKRNSRTKAREQVRRALEEKRREVTSSGAKRYERHVTYETDETDLIPEVKKVNVESEPVARKMRARDSGDTKGKKYVIENKGAKILMHGKLKIQDATDEEFGSEDTVHLGPRILTASEKRTLDKKLTDIKQKKVKEPEDFDIASKNIGISSVREEKGTDARENFLRRLEALENNQGPSNDDLNIESKTPLSQDEEMSIPVPGIQTTPTAHTKAEPLSAFYRLLIPSVLLVSLISSGITVFLESTWDYTSVAGDTGGNLSSSIHFTVDGAQLKNRLLNK